MNLIIDVGNTRVKWALFNNSKLVKTVVEPYSTVNKSNRKCFKKNKIDHIIVSLVGTEDIFDQTLFKDHKNVMYLDHTTRVPFKNNYESPKTLGVDRIALVSAAAIKYPKKNVLIIDAGTCITYDILNKKNEYLGGAISPGINIRFKALNEYTANLPLLKIARFSLLGKNTRSSILSGVLNGTIQEIEGVIKQYSHKYPDLTVVLTGGDANFLAKKLKSSIFAIPNFLLEGLNRILIHNTDE